VSGEYLNGKDWRYADPGDTLSPGQTATSPKRSCTRTEYGCRNFNLEKWGGEARLDVKPNDDTEWITSYGISNAGSLIELTGIGAGQARDWRYQHVQSRFRYKEFFAQGFVNMSDAGETFLLRDGNALVDKSRLWSGQVQHGFSVGERQTFVYGADYIFTDGRTEGTINGSNEDDDDIKELGAYVHSVSRLSDKLDVVAALRVDKHSRLESAVFSPRLALVLKPNPEHNMRLTYNRAFSTPSSLNLFLDISAGRIALSPQVGYTIRAMGVPKGGFQFRANGGCTGGVGSGLCMRTPFAPQLGLLPASANLLWSAAVAAVLPTVQAVNPLLATLLQNVGAPSATQVGTTLRRLNITTRSFADVNPNDVTDIQTLKPSIANTFEFGYRYDQPRKVSFSFSGYFEHRENFVGPLIVESPSVFFDAATLQAYLQARLLALGLPAASLPAALGSLVPAMAQIPLATVVPNAAGGGARDDLVSRSDIFLTYRNFGTVDLFGADLAFDYFFNDRVSLAATYSWVNKDFFSAAEVEGPSPIALNGSKNRGSATLRYRNDVAGWSTEARVRAAKGFPINSGVYISPQNADGTFQPTDDYAVVDVGGSWRPPIGVRNMLLSLSVQNVFNKGYVTFVGVPTIGRLVLSKVSYTF
jgi:iron complex outermembrane receptor protein